MYHLDMFLCVFISYLWPSLKWISHHIFAIDWGDNLDFQKLNQGPPIPYYASTQTNTKFQLFDREHYCTGPRLKNNIPPPLYPIVLATLNLIFFMERCIDLLFTSRGSVQLTKKDKFQNIHWLRITVSNSEQPKVNSKFCNMETT